MERGRLGVRSLMHTYTFREFSLLWHQVRFFCFTISVPVPKNCHQSHTQSEIQSHLLPCLFSCSPWTPCDLKMMQQHIIILNEVGR
jgi:hypothetical protein